MTTTSIKKLRALSDSFAEDILTFPAEEINATLKDCYDNPELAIKEIQHDIKNLIIKARKQRLQDARINLAKARSTSAFRSSYNLNQLKTAVESIFSQFASELPSGLTLAYREGKYASEQDLNGLLEDLHDLGFFENNQKT